DSARSRRRRRRGDQRDVVRGLEATVRNAGSDKTLYIAATDGVWMFPYVAGSKPKSNDGKKIMDLPSGGYNNHWTRNIVSDGKKLYISVGSASNVAEHGMDEEKHRANILVANLDGSGLKVFADGLRNPVGMAWQPSSKELWTVVNERDELGDDLVPDYLTSVGEGKFYGWPYSYFGQHEDPRLKGKRPDLVAKAVVPDFALDPHSASLGLTFYEGKTFPKRFGKARSSVNAGRGIARSSPVTESRSCRSPRDVRAAKPRIF
ncbi:MAG: PQQ-dependent sugar dehydrogenase, partial [Pirellulales bacterium]